MEKWNGITPGVYLGVENEVYHQSRAMSSTALSEFARSPAHFRAYLTGPKKQSAAFAFGDGTHSFLLEPGPAADRYMFATRCSAKVKSTGKPCENQGNRYWDGDWWCGTKGHCPGEPEQPPKPVINEDDMPMIQQCVDNVWSHPGASAILKQLGDNEVSVVAEVDGVLCRCRFDALRAGIATAADIKTTRDSSPDYFKKSIFNFGYYLQAGLYMLVGEAAGLELEHFAFIAIEKTPPFPVMAYVLTSEVLELGKEQVRGLLAKYRQCVAEDHWPAYGDEIVDIGLPTWAWSRIERGEE